MLAVSAVLLLMVGFVACVYETRNVTVELGGDRTHNTLECNLTLPVVFYKKKKDSNDTSLANIGPLHPAFGFSFIEKIEGQVLKFEEDKLKDPLDLERYDFVCEMIGGTTEIIYEIKIKPRCKVEDGSKKLSVTVGAFRELICILETGNYTNTHWTWLKDSKPINTSLSKYTLERDNHESKLKIMDVDKEDQGFYTCVLKNDYGTYNQTIEFRVIGVFDSLLYYLIVFGQVGAMTIGFLIFDKKSQKKKNEDEDERSMQRTARA